MAKVFRDDLLAPKNFVYLSFWSFFFRRTQQYFTCTATKGQRYGLRASGAGNPRPFAGCCQSVCLGIEKVPTAFNKI